MQIAEDVRIDPAEISGGVPYVKDGAKPDVALSASENKDLLLLLRQTKPLPPGAVKPQEHHDYTLYLARAAGKDDIRFQRPPSYFYWSRSGIIQEAQYKQDFSWGVVPEEFRVKVKALLIKRRREIEAAHRIAPSPSPRPSAPVSQDSLPLPHPQ